MKKIIKTMIAGVLSVCFIAFTGCGDSSGCSKSDIPEKEFVSKPVVGTPILFDEGMSYYNASPSVVQESETTRYIFYTVNKTADKDDTVIAVRKADMVDGAWNYGEKKIILSGSESGWDSTFIANPAVVKGAFALNGENYSWLMAYQGTNTNTQGNYNIGLAVAKEPLGEWVKVGTSPVIEYDEEGFGDAYGVGEASLVSYDKEGKVYLFHSMGDMLTTGIYVCELDAADLSNIKGATRQNAVTNFGLVDPGAAVPTFADTDFKLDSESGMLYAVRNYYPVAATAPNLPIAVQLISMPLADLYKANSEWTVIEEQINDLDLSTAENDGWERVYSACIVGDEYGRVDNATSLELNLTVTSYDKETFEYLYYQAITSCTVTLS